jgi:hypothetical protein
VVNESDVESADDQEYIKTVRQRLDATKKQDTELARSKLTEKRIKAKKRLNQDRDKYKAERSELGSEKEGS